MIAKIWWYESVGWMEMLIGGMTEESIHMEDLSIQKQFNIFHGLVAVL